MIVHREEVNSEFKGYTLHQICPGFHMSPWCAADQKTCLEILLESLYLILVHLFANVHTCRVLCTTLINNIIRDIWLEDAYQLCDPHILNEALESVQKYILRVCYKY